MQALPYQPCAHGGAVVAERGGDEAEEGSVRFESGGLVVQSEIDGLGVCVKLHGADDRSRKGLLVVRR